MTLLNELGLGLCECGHSVFMHDIRKDRSRSRCCFIAGPRGVQCSCLNYRESSDEQR